MPEDNARFDERMYFEYGKSPNLQIFLNRSMMTRAEAKKWCEKNHLLLPPKHAPPEAVEEANRRRRPWANPDPPLPSFVPPPAIEPLKLLTEYSRSFNMQELAATLDITVDELKSLCHKHNMAELPYVR